MKKLVLPTALTQETVSFLGQTVLTALSPEQIKVWSQLKKLIQYEENLIWRAIFSSWTSQSQAELSYCTAQVHKFITGRLLI